MGVRTFARIKHLFGTSCWLVRLTLSRVKLYFRFACKTEHFVIWNVCIVSVHFQREYSMRLKVLRLAMEYADSDKCKIVYSSPEAMVEFSGEKKLKLSPSARQKPISL